VDIEAAAISRHGIAEPQPAVGNLSRAGLSRIGFKLQLAVESTAYSG